MIAIEDSQNGPTARKLLNTEKYLFKTTATGGLISATLALDTLSDQLLQLTLTAIPTGKPHPYSRIESPTTSVEYILGMKLISTFHHLFQDVSFFEQFIIVSFYSSFFRSVQQSIGVDVGSKHSLRSYQAHPLSGLHFFFNLPNGHPRPSQQTARGCLGSPYKTGAKPVMCLKVHTALESAKA